MSVSNKELERLEVGHTVKKSFMSALKLVTVVPEGGRKEYTKFEPFEP